MNNIRLDQKSRIVENLSSSCFLKDNRRPSDHAVNPSNGGRSTVRSTISIMSCTAVKEVVPSGNVVQPPRDRITVSW